MAGVPPLVVPEGPICRFIRGGLFGYDFDRFESCSVEPLCALLLSAAVLHESDAPVLLVPEYNP